MHWQVLRGEKERAGYTMAQLQLLYTVIPIYVSLFRFKY